MNSEFNASAIEAMLFAAGDAVETDALIEVLNLTQLEFNDALILLTERYSSGGLQLLKFADKLQLSTRKEYAEHIERLLNPEKRKTLSQAALEVLSIIAYKQPVTRGDIEQIRGVKCDYTVSLLEARGLIRDVGRRDTLGHPVLFGTTDEFLKLVGISALNELPSENILSALIDESDGENADE